MELVSHVDSVQIFSFPPLGLPAGTLERILVIAVGKAPSSGWSRATLAEVYPIDPPADGLWNMSFVADPPSGPVLPNELPIMAVKIFPRPDWLLGVRVKAKHNQIEALDIRFVEQKEVQSQLGSLTLVRRMTLSWPIRLRSSTTASSLLACVRGSP